jgi:hypothetical protein
MLEGTEEQLLIGQLEGRPHDRFSLTADGKKEVAGPHGK